MTDLIVPLKPEDLRRYCVVPRRTAKRFSSFACLGTQQRLCRSLAAGLRLQRDRPRHIFVTGFSGAAAVEAVAEHIRIAVAGQASAETIYKEIVLVADLEHPHEPRSLTLPPGKGIVLQRLIHQLRDELEQVIHMGMNQQEVIAAQQRLFYVYEDWRVLDEARIIQGAYAEGILISVAHGNTYLYDFVSKKSTGDDDGPIKMLPAEYQMLTAAEQTKLEDAIIKWRKEMDQHALETRKRRLDARNEQQHIVRQTIRSIVEISCQAIFDKIEREGMREEAVVSYVMDLREYAIHHYELRVIQQQEFDGQNGPAEILDSLLPFQVHVLVAAGPEGLVPVIVELDPNYDRMIGRVGRGYAGGGGMPYADHTMVSAGALLKANGGYLVVDAYDLLVRDPFVWPAIKTALTTKACTIEDRGVFFPLRVPAIPLNVTVVMVGSDSVWQALCINDPHFKQLFSIKAEGESFVSWEPTEEAAYAEWIRAGAISCGAPPFERDAIAAVIEHAGRLAGSKRRLSTDAEQLFLLVAESGLEATSRQSKRVRASHVRAALSEQYFRSSLAYEFLHLSISEGKISITVQGYAIGQINALVTASLGDRFFGFPSRLSAIGSRGSMRITHADRAVRLSGPILAKANHIVEAYLRARYGKERVLPVRISVAFEQNYGFIDGDSASLAECCAVISSLSGMPIRQDIAVTGSLSQNGSVQAVGLVNEKIEGYFDTCAYLGGPHSPQGIIIPSVNVPDLMLDTRVIEAVKEGLFNIWSVTNVDEALTLLMGQSPEMIDATIHARVSHPRISADPPHEQ